MIEVFASRLTDEGKEEYATDRRWGVLEWLYANGIAEGVQLDALPMSVYLDGMRLLPAQWAKTTFDPSENLEIYREPKGTDPFSITAALIFGAKAVLGFLTPKIPTLRTASSKSGKDLDSATAKGNKVKINDIRAECAGRNKARYPDYLVVPHRYFAGPREQRMELMLAVGVGEYDIPDAGVKMGQTPIIGMGDDGYFSIYQPGADLTEDPAHYYWYQVPEVGASSTGANGLELTVTTTLTTSVTASSLTFASDTVSIPTGSGTFPSDWTAGLIIDIAAPYAYTVTDGTGDDDRDVITGDITQLNFVAGDTIDIQGDNSGQYIVHSVTAGSTDGTLQLDYAGGAKATGLSLGNVTMAVGFRGQRFQILTRSDQTLRVIRLKSDGITQDTGWPGWTARSTSQGQILLDPSNLEGGYRGWFPACPVGELVTCIEVSNFCPSGLIGLGAKGEEFNLFIYIDLDYQDMAGGPVVTTRLAHSATTYDASGFTDRVYLPYPMRPQIRQRKVFVQQGGLRASEYHDTTMWMDAYALMPSGSKTSYEGMTTMSANIRGGDRISSDTESQISVDCTRKLPVLRGGVWQSAQPTREISAWVGYVCRNIGYSDTQDLDIAELERLESNYWTPRGDWYDKIINTSFTVKEALIEVLRVGFSELTIDRGVIVPVRDQPRGDVFDHMYNPQVMTEALSYDFTAPDQPDDFDGVDVTYFSNITLQNETVPCRLDGDAGERVETITVDGVGDEWRAWRIGMRQRRSHVYRTKQYSFKTELDALNSGYLDYVALGVTTPGYGQSAFLRDFSVQADGSVMLWVSEALDWSKVGVYKVIVRRKDGTASGPYVATRVDDYTFTIPSLDFSPDLSGIYETPFVQFGHSDNWCFPALVQSVSPSGTKTCAVKAVNYDERMYADDDNYPPA